MCSGGGAPMTGFQMYESELSHWNAKEMGPKRDLLGELKSAAESCGLQFCTSSHRAEHWFFMGHGREFDSDVREPMKKGDFYWPAMPEPDPQDLFSKPFPSEEFLDDWLARTVELIVKYRPKLLYFDWWIQHEAFHPYLKKLAAFYYNCGKSWERCQNLLQAGAWSSEAGSWRWNAADLRRQSRMRGDGHGGGAQFLVLCRQPRL